MSTNPTKYRMYFNYDNDKKVYVVPVLPEKIEVTSNGQTTSIDIDKFGEILHKGKRDALSISFSSFFPAIYSQNYCSCTKSEFKNPKKWHDWMLSLQEAENPCHFVLEGSPFALNMYADIVSYSGIEAGGDVGTISYSVELKEHRKPTVSTYKKTTSKTTKKTTTKVTTSGKRSSNKEKDKTYTVETGDYLQKISKKFYGTVNKADKIYKANKNVIEKAAKKHGRSSSNNGWWIYPGTKLTIPA